MSSSDSFFGIIVIERIEREIAALQVQVADLQRQIHTLFSVLGAQTGKLHDSQAALENAVKSNQPHFQFKETTSMAASNPTLDALTAQVAATVGVEQSAVVFINGEAGRIQAAVQTALALGATAEQLAAVQAEVEQMKASSQALASAIATNTPPA